MKTAQFILTGLAPLSQSEELLVTFFYFQFLGFLFVFFLLHNPAFL